MTRTRRSVLGLISWIALTLFVAGFHEPWRDEAQAWLVVKSASSLSDLIFRASMEASGPVYYLLLYPAAKLFPTAFPTPIFLVSWLGTALFVALLFFSELLPEPVTWLVAFGFLFGYEYGVLARLYGWGCFLLLAGIWAELRGKRWSAWPLAAVCLVQLSFVFAVAAWCADRVLRGRNPLRYWPIALGLALAAAHLHLASELRPWAAWVGTDNLWPRLGTTLAVAFVHGPRLATAGILIFLLALYPLDWRGRAAMVCGMLPLVFVFVFRYSGTASTRHAGPLFLVWLVLGSSVVCATAVAARRAVFGILVFASTVSGLVSMGLDIARPFSDGLALARAIAADSTGRPPVHLFVDEEVDGFVTSAALNASPLYPHGSPMGCPFYPRPCAGVLADRRALQQPFAPDAFAPCGREWTCYFLTRLKGNTPPGRWQPVFESKGAIRESLNGYRLLTE